jgi:hypothetical protein
LVVWGYGLLVLALNCREEAVLKAGTAFLVLLASLAWLLFQFFYEQFESGGSSEISWWLVAWVALGWSDFAGWCRSPRKELRGAACAVLLASLLAIGAIAGDWWGAEWLSVVFFTVALGWAVVGGRAKLENLAFSSLLPASVGTILLLIELNSPRELLNSALIVSLVLVAAWWVVAWRDREKLQEVALLEVVRTALLGTAILVAYCHWLENEPFILLTMATGSAALVGWRFLRSESLSWLGGTFALVAIGSLCARAAATGVHPAAVVVVAILAAADGIWLSRPNFRLGALSDPKVASFLGGTAVILVVFAGFGLAGVASWTTASWAVGCVALLVCGFWVGLRGYRVIALLGLGVTIVRLFLVDIDDSFWRIVAFGITGALLVGIGYLYNRFHQRLAEGDLDWGEGEN